jgi:uncharacterized RDD family membrane protein YckC
MTGIKFGRRAGAYVIDSVIQVVVSIVLGLVIGFAVAVVAITLGRDTPPSSQLNLPQDFLVGLVLTTLYHTLFEGLFGATPGKLILRMRVIKSDGQPCGLGPAFLRAVLLNVDGLFFGLVAYSSMKTPLYQRLGDKAAKTVVVGAQDAAIQQPRAWWWVLISSAGYLAASALWVTIVSAASYT